MRSRQLACVAISLLSIYGCGGSSSSPDATDLPKDKVPDTATGSGGGGGDGGVDKPDSADAKDAVDLPAPDATDSGNGGDGGGDTGLPPACTVATECPGQDSECAHRTCVAGVCGTANEALGKILATQVIGDCRVRQCAANGTPTTVTDDNDIPDDINPCTLDACSGGVASHTPVAKDTACGGGKSCNGSGQCTGCNVASDCSGTDNFCRTRTCVQSICGVTFQAAGTKLVDAQSGDCKIQQCDGAGVIQTVASPTDLPVDNNPCTLDECNDTTPTHQPVARSTSCGGAQVCDGASHCVTCLTASTCPGTDTECQTRTCINGACGTLPTAAGTVVAAQTTGDCSKKQCDGHGAIVNVNDLTDPFVDNNPCTSDLCTGGAPSNPDLPARTTCGPSLLCDGNGLCVTCLTVADCPGTDTECKVRTCTDGHCGFALTAAGTAVSVQIQGDCHKDQCDGNGAVATVVDDTDTQNDNNLCTDDVCTGGVVSHPNYPSKMTCGTNLECDGSGNCVGCLQAPDCGVNTECVAFSCTNGMCGKTTTPAGTSISIQMAGDCKKNQCDGNGNAVTVSDNTDLPVDGIDCTMDVCTNGVPSNPALPSTVMCTQAGGMKCNGSGACVQCVQPSDCGTDTTGCQTFTCSPLGVCGVVNAAPGSSPVDGMGNPILQMAGDCQKIVCDGNGQRTSVAANDDPPIDNNGCTADVCTDGMPSNPPLATTATCNANGGTHCNGAGACVACNTAADCGTSTECKTYTCDSNACSTATSPVAGTPLMMSEQTPGDCHTATCDGSGNPSGSVINDNDPLVDHDPCVTHTCSNGQAENMNNPPGTPCGATSMCDGLGQCVGCLSDNDCNASDTECMKHVCNMAMGGVCQNTPVASTHVMSTGQIGDDCKQLRCDGAGNPNSPVPDPTDNDDGNPCTADSCGGTDGTVPMHDNLAGTDCSAGGPHMICSNDSVSVCVGCNAAADCGADSLDGCTVHTCINHACGLNNPVAGTAALTGQMMGDCHTLVCDGMGGTTNQVTVMDVPVDNKQCTVDSCDMNGMPSNPAQPAGTVCTEGTGNRCDGINSCVATFMVVRIGDPAGTGATTSAATMVNVEIRAVSDGSVVSTVAMPTAAKSASSPNYPFTSSGTASSEGGLTRSTDTHYVTLAGYATVPNPGGPTVKGTAATATPRVVGRIDASNVVDTSTTLGTTAFSKDNVRGAVTDTGSRFWITGDGNAVVAAQGLFFATLGATTSTQVDSLKGSRVCSIFASNLYCTSSTSTPTPTNTVFRVASGLPDGTGGVTATFTPLTIGTPVDTTASPFAFVFGDANTLYVADERAPAAGTGGAPSIGGGIQKWTSADGTTWTLKAVFDAGLTATTAGVRGLAVDTSSGSTVLIATTAPAAGANNIVKCTDNGVTSQAAVPAFTTMSSSGISTFFRGVALPPK